jgi:hypothetical protein
MEAACAAAGHDLDVLQIERGGEAFLATTTDRRAEAGDLLTVRASLQTANRVAGDYGLRHRHRDEVTEDDLSETPHRGTLAEVVIPVGYQTNLMVYGPGGYRFTDYVRVGAPLQALVTVVTTLGLVVLWGL